MIQCQFEIIISWPVYMNIIVGTKLIVKAYEIILHTEGMWWFYKC